MRWVRQVILGVMAVCLGAGCDHPLRNMPPVPAGQVQQAIACPALSTTCNPILVDSNIHPLIGTCTPCADCVSTACVTKVCSCAGVCTATNQPDGTSCDDGNKCNGIETCSAGGCAPGTAVTCTAQDRCHAAGACDPGTGTCSNPNQPDGTSCDDGNKCNGIETCKTGACAAGTAVTCSALDRCHAVGACDPGTGTCSNPNQPNGTNCDDGNKCNGIETCQGGSCAAGTAVTCSAMDRCHTVGACNPSTGTCSNPSQADGTNCDDGNKCNGIETCKSGLCAAGTAVTCTVLDRCHSVGTCAPNTGTCSNPARGDGADCDDGNKCNGLETCHGGVCSAGTAITCTAKDGCHKLGTCDPASGACSNPLAPDGTSCGNDNKCSGTSACHTGVCTAGVAISCPAQDKCHGSGSCDATSGMCSNPSLPDGTNCDDGDPCNGPEMCQHGVCVSGPPLACVPPDACHTATCSQTDGMCLFAVTGNCADGGLPVDAADDGGSTADGGSNPDTDVTADASGNDAGALDGSNGTGGAGAHPSDAGASDGGRRRVAIGGCRYTPGGSNRNPIVLLAVLWAALRRRRKNRG
ncbi:MAG TPA: hypothetical protein VGL59_02315 [Polyangia bacterium]|jgi:hypothetical protein